MVINTAGVRDTTGNVKKLGTINPGEVSEYQRVKIAFPKAEITAKINGETFSTGPVNSTYMDYIGQMRITYEVYISNMTNKVLMINNVIPEEAICRRNNTWQTHMKRKNSQQFPHAHLQGCGI